MSSLLFTVPVSVTAKTRDELTMACLQVQMNTGLKVRFFDINFVKGEWIAWYEIDMESALIKASNE